MVESRFLADLHARFGASRGAVVGLVTRVTGAGVAGMQRITRGYDNEVHRVDLEDSRTVYVRILRDADDRFDHELWAMGLARDHGVPVPEVVGVDEVPGDRGARAAMVIAPAPGRQLKELWPELGSDERQAVLLDLGRVVARLHQVRTPGPWRPGPDGRWPEPADLRRGYLRDRRAERAHLEAAGLTADEIDRTLGELEPSPVPAMRDFVLCHGDLSPEHVFVGDGLRISCVIDWGMWHGGSELGELAYLSTTFPADEFPVIVTGTGRRPDAALRRTIARVVVSQLIGHIAHHVTIGDAAGTAQNVAHLRRALAELP